MAGRERRRKERKKEKRKEGRKKTNHKFKLIVSRFCVFFFLELLQVGKIKRRN